MVELPHDGEHVRQLESSLDARMTGQDLLDQGRAGARQADDEDRARDPRVRSPARCSEELGIEKIAHPPCLVLEFG